MVPTSWRVREGGAGGAVALMLRCCAARTELVRLVGRLPVGVGALSDTAALADRRTSVLQRSCSARDEGCECRSYEPCDKSQARIWKSNRPALQRNQTFVTSYHVLPYHTSSEINQKSGIYHFRPENEQHWRPRYRVCAVCEDKL